MGIILDHISLGYGSRTLIEDASATLHRGTLTALIGRNGTGKSTLLRAIASLGEISAGTISLCGTPSHLVTEQQRATMISFVTTDKVRIANLTATDVVALGRAPYTNWIGHMQPHDSNIVAEALSMVGMEAFAAKSMDSLSDGEAQRIMIARALAQATPLMLLDEPTAFLDLPNRYALAQLLADLAHRNNKCILFSTHDLDIALTLCDTILMIDTPRLHHMPADKMAQSGLIEQLFKGETVDFDPSTCTIRMVKR